MTLRLEYDPEANAAYFRFASGAVQESAEYGDGIVLDYDAKGRIVGMEVLDARRRLSPDLLSEAA